jgi:hypothetical protein
MYQIKWGRVIDFELLKSLFQRQRLCNNMIINGEKERTLKVEVVVSSRLLFLYSS